MTANLVKVQEALGDRVGRDVFMYSVTLDAERDTPDALKKFAEAYDVKPGWLFLTGDPNDIEKLRRKLGFVDIDPEVDKDRTQHIGVVVIGNDKLRRWCATPALSEANQIAKTVSWMDPARSRQPNGAGPPEL
jgi:protein SCO1/2